MQSFVIDSGSVIEDVQVLEVDKVVSCGVAGVIEAALWQAAIEGLCPTFSQESATASSAGVCALMSSAGSFSQA